MPQSHRKQNAFQRQLWSLEAPGTPLTYFNDKGGGGLSDFLGSEILAKSDFFGSMKDVGIFLAKKKRIFWGCEKTKRFFWVC